MQDRHSYCIMNGGRTDTGAFAARTDEMSHPRRVLHARDLKMAATKPMNSVDVSDIQRQMAQIRNQMHQEVQGAVEECAIAHGLAGDGEEPSLGVAVGCFGRWVSPRPASASARSHDCDHGRAQAPRCCLSAPRQAPAPAKEHLEFVGTAFSLLAPSRGAGRSELRARSSRTVAAQHPCRQPAGRPDARPASSLASQLGGGRTAPRIWLTGERVSRPSLRKNNQIMTPLSQAHTAYTGTGMDETSLPLPVARASEMAPASRRSGWPGTLRKSSRLSS